MGSVFHLSTHSLPIPGPAIIQSSLDLLTWFPSSACTKSISISASIEVVPLVGRMLCNNALTRNSTLALGSCTHNSSVTNLLRCLCYPQAALPLSYAAQIPITRDPDLANVRISVSNMGHQVRKCCACVFVSVRFCAHW